MCLTKTGLKAFLLVINVLLFLCGGIVIGIGVWAVMDKIFISDVIGNNLFRSAAIITVVSGSLLVITSFIGCGAALSMKKIPVIFYTIVVEIIFILLLTAAILCAVFQGDLESSMREGMTKTLIENYGYLADFKEHNQDVTKSWDILQSRLKCCAVDDRGWGLYEQTRWFIRQFKQEDQEYVPPSCCKYVGSLNQYQNLERCQSFRYGPPRYTLPDGAENPDLYYDGCFDAAKQLVTNESTLILAVGFSFCVFLISAVVISIMYLGKIAKRGGRADLRR